MLRTGIRGCSFARATEEFKTGHDPTDANRVLCIVKGRYSPWPRDYRLVISDNYFEDSIEAEPDLEPGRTVQGLVNMATVKKFMVVAAKASGTDEMALYVTTDTATWHRAMFQGEHKVEEDAYTILESTDYSIQVDVLNTRPTVGMGALFTSNSNGTYFTRNVDHTHRGIRGYADFEKIQNIQGIVLVNVVGNWEEVEKSPRTKKKVRSQISFDDGRTFKSLRAGEEDLHLHSVTDVRDPGRIFSSPAPGIVMGVGNTGDKLKPYEDCDTYISDDAGLTWRKTRDGPHKYEFGDQGAVLVAIADKKFTNQLAYSINHGQSWEYVELDEKIRVSQLTTTSDSTTLKFLLLGQTEGESDDKPYRVLAIDFEGMHERKCGEDDLERWCARKDDKGECDCLMGHQQFFQRRKADADCFIDEEFKNPKPEFVKCVCTDEDFECDYNFVPSGDKCLQTKRFKASEGECKDPKGTFKGSSGWRLFPGNECIREGGSKKDEPKEWPCEDLIEPPVNKDISREMTNFEKDLEFREKYYLPRAQTSTGTDETIIMRTDRKLYITHDHGKNWEPILEDKHVEAIYKHDFFNDVVFFITEGKTVYYTTDRGKHFHEFKAPLKPNTLGMQILSFHPDHKDWLIWTGAQDCEDENEECHAVASISTDRGDTWKTLLRYVRRCQFIPEEHSGKGPLAGDGASEQHARSKRIFCAQHENEDKRKPKQLVASKDFFEDKTVHLPDIIDFTTMSEFLVVAAKAEERDSLKVVTSIDGQTFADAKFPPDFDVHHESAYTVLNSSTHAVFLHVTVNDREGHEYGSILKSNSNGTSYVLSIAGVNRNGDGYADFEKMKGLEGVALVNVVDNVEETKAGSEKKKIKTMITHNDGAEWMLLAPPKTGVEGKDIGCSVDDDGQATETCSLHLHGYTERINPGNTYSSASAVGLMLATGNVGEYLLPAGEADTFMTNDGGISWKMIKEGRYLWEYGDQGAIIVIVAHSQPTNEVFYSINEGQTWESYRFTEDNNKKMVISDISTVPSDESQNFLLWGQFEDDDRTVTTVNLDFTGLRDRQCILDENDPEKDDYYLWIPQHPAQDNDCLFGHVSQYHRKRPDRDCFNGRPIQHLHSIATNCTCTRRDFEWYVLQFLHPSLVTPPSVVSLDCLPTSTPHIPFKILMDMNKWEVITTTPLKKMVHAAWSRDYPQRTTPRSAVPTLP